jgi:hypothetical protein
MGFGFDALHSLERLNPTHNGSVLSIVLLSLLVVIHFHIHSGYLDDTTDPHSPSLAPHL